MLKQFWKPTGEPVGINAVNVTHIVEAGDDRTIVHFEKGHTVEVQQPFNEVYNILNVQLAS